MSKIKQQNGGGAAFPHDEIHEPVEGGRHIPANVGMSLRDYFIAHAPAEPQPWFEPDMPSRRPAPKFVSDEDPARVFKTWREAEMAVGMDSYHDANLEAAGEWDAERQKQRYIQWPAAWADEMLKQRSKP